MSRAPAHISFYIATDFLRKPDALRVVGSLEAIKGFELNARWLTVQEVLLEGGLGGELTGEAAEAAMKIAVEDLEDIYSSDVFIQLTNGEKARGGRHVELGYAMNKLLRGFGKVVVVGPREHAFHYHPMVMHCPDESALLYWAHGYAAGLNR